MKVVIVCGGRDYDDHLYLYETLDEIAPRHIIVGGAKGADSLAQRWAAMNDVAYTRIPAKWDEQGKAAGMIRNREMAALLRMMLNSGYATEGGVVAFLGGRGTENMIKTAGLFSLPILWNEFDHVEK